MSLVAAVSTVCIISGLQNFAAAGAFDAFFAVVLQQRLGLNARGITSTYSALSTISFLVSAFAAAPAQRKLGPVATCLLGLTCVASGLGGIGCPASSIGALNDARTSAGIGGRLKSPGASSSV